MHAWRAVILGTAIGLALAAGACGDSGGVATGKEADRADGIARAAAQALAGVVDACRVQHPTYRECNESDELEVFAAFCQQRNVTNPARCGGAHTLEGLVFGDGPGQVEVAAASRRGYTIKAYSTSGIVFAIVKRPGRPPQRECFVSGGNRRGCPNGRW